MEAAKAQITLRELPLGGRLLVRSRKDWRVAVVCRIGEEKVVLSICSPTGRNYRLYRVFDSEVVMDGRIPFLKYEDAEPWRDNFTSYDLRW
jgi:hypothetical protein